MNEYNGYVNGHIERKRNGLYEGSVTIEGIELQGGITAVFFQENGENYLWLRRKRVLEYDDVHEIFKERDAKPQWEAYLKKQMDNDVVAYKGDFIFMRFKYSIVGVWDRILGKDNQRLNLYIERLPMAQQSIINNIRDNNTNNNE